MMKRFRHIRRNERGAGAVEFALAAPVLFTMVIGVAQLGALAFANSEVQHAVEEAARKAAVYPTPADADLIAEINASRFGDGTGTMTPVIQHGEASDGMDYVDITLNYEVPLNFIFFSVDPVTVSHTRRVFKQQDTPPVPQDEEEEGEGEGDGDTGGGDTGGGDSGGGDSGGGGDGDKDKDKDPDPVPDPDPDKDKDKDKDKDTGPVPSSSTTTGGDSNGNGGKKDK